MLSRPRHPVFCLFSLHCRPCPLIWAEHSRGGRTGTGAPLVPASGMGGPVTCSHRLIKVLAKGLGRGPCGSHPSVLHTPRGGREPLCGPSGPSGENDPGRQGCGHPHLGWRELTPGVRSRVCPFLPCSPEGGEGPGFCEGSAQSPFIQVLGKMTSQIGFSQDDQARAGGEGVLTS